MNGSKSRLLRKEALKHCDPEKGLMLGQKDKIMMGRKGMPVKVKSYVLQWHPQSKRAIYQTLKRVATHG